MSSLLILVTEQRVAATELEPVRERVVPVVVVLQILRVHCFAADSVRCAHAVVDECLLVRTLL